MRRHTPSAHRKAHASTENIVALLLKRLSEKEFISLSDTRGAPGFAGFALTGFCAAFGGQRFL